MVANKRYHDLDAARAFMMFLCVMLHAANVYAPAKSHVTANLDRSVFFDWMANTIQYFNTQTFFFVSAFFTMIILHRHGLRRTLLMRMPRLIIPVITLGMTLNVVENYLRWRDAGHDASFAVYLGHPDFVSTWTGGNWQLHLWFMVLLLAYTLITICLAAALQHAATLQRSIFVTLTPIVDRLSAPAAIFAVPVLLGCISFALCGAASLLPAAYDMVAPGTFSPYAFARHLPYFAAGLLAGVFPAFLASARSWNPGFVGMAVAATVLMGAAKPALEAWSGNLALLLGLMTTWSMIFAVLQIFHRYFREENATLTLLAGASFSVYLIHHGLVYMLGTLLVPVDVPPILEFLVMVASISAAILTFHIVVMRRSSLLMFLLNGRLPTRTRTAGHTPVGPMVSPIRANRATDLSAVR